MMIKFRKNWSPSFPSIVPRDARKHRRRKITNTLNADGDTTETVSRTLVSVNQISIYGAVSDLCDEYRARQPRTERPVLAGQSDPLSEPTRLLITTLAPVTDDSAKEDLLQNYQERVERPSQQNRTMKFCTDAGFLKTVEVGQYLIPEGTDGFLQSTERVTCCAYTLPRDEKSFDPKGWIRGNTNIAAVETRWYAL